MDIHKKQQDTKQGRLHAGVLCAAAFVAWAQLEISNSVPKEFILRQLPWLAWNMGLAACITLVLLALLGRWSAAVLGSGTVFTVLALVNYYARDLHGAAVMPQDVLNVGTAADVLGSYTLHIRPPVLVIAGLGVLVLAVGWLHRKQAGDRLTFPQRRSAAVLGAAVVLAGGVLLPAPQNGWHWQEYYYTHGYLVGTVQVTRLLADPVVRPAGYTAQAAAQSAGAGEPAATQETPDVLLILSESWYDLSLVTDLQADADPFAHYNALPGAVRGHAVSPHVGGGTNTSEYALLTANSTLLLPSITPFNSLDLRGANSLLRYFKELGYATMAAHPQTGANYRRETGWADLGFDETHFEADFTTEQTWGSRPYQTDAATYADWLALYNAMPADRPRFAFLVSIQNHGDYDMNDAALDIVHAGTDYGFYDSVVDEYLSCMALTDAALPVLTEQLTRLYAEEGRKVVLVMVGDHAPSFVDHIADQTIPYETCLTLERSTPFLIWANYPMKEAAPTPDPIDLPALGPLLLRRAGLPLTPYFASLWALQGQQPLYARSWDQPLSEAQQRYFYLEYNNLTAGGQRLQSAFEPPAA